MKKSLNLVPSTIVDILGTFVLVFIPLSLAAQGKPLIIVAAAFGITLMTLVTAFGSVSGGHFNPGVTFAMFLSGKISVIALPLYWFGQVLGAWLASQLVATLFGLSGLKLGAAAPADTLGFWMVASIETFGAYLLSLHILGSTDEKMENDFLSLAPVAIGATLGILIFTFGEFTGGSFNQARYIGPAFTVSLWTMWPAYILLPFVGSGLASLTHRLLMKNTTPPA